MSKLRFLMAAMAATLLTTPLAAQVGSLSDGSLMSDQSSSAPAQPAEEDFTREVIGDWALECASTGPEPRPCRMHQVLKDQTGAAVAEVTMYRLPEGAPAAAGATFIVPLQTLLPQQLTLALDGVLANRVPYTYCTQIGCLARMGLSAIEAEAYKNGQTVTVSLVPAVAPDQVVSVNMSLNGFKEAYEKSTAVSGQ